MAEKTAIIPTKKETRIAPWGDRKDIREIAQRIQLMAPGAKKLSENEALALAQGAVAHGLDPFNGEIWFIPGSGLMAGIKGLRKAARNQIDGNFWTEFDEIVDPDERKRLYIPVEALAYKCILRDSNTIRAYSESWKKLNEDGVPIEVIPDIIGSRPFTVGVGYFKKDEKSKMDPVQVAMKRSEADAIKRRFDLPFATSSEPIDVFVEGEWSEATNEYENDSQELPPIEQEAIPEALPEVRQQYQWEQTILEKLIDLGLTNAREHAVNTLEQSPFKSVPYGDLEIVEAVAYFIGRAKLKKEFPDIESEERVAVVNEAWIAGKNGDWLDKAIEMLNIQEREDVS